MSNLCKFWYGHLFDLDQTTFMPKKISLGLFLMDIIVQLRVGKEHSCLYVYADTTLLFAYS